MDDSFRKDLNNWHPKEKEFNSVAGVACVKIMVRQ